MIGNRQAPGDRLVGQSLQGQIDQFPLPVRQRRQIDPGFFGLFCGHKERVEDRRNEIERREGSFVPGPRYARKADIGACLGIRIYHAVGGDSPQAEPLQLLKLALAWNNLHVSFVPRTCLVEKEGLPLGCPPRKTSSRRQIEYVFEGRQEFLRVAARHQGTHPDHSTGQTAIGAKKFFEGKEFSQRSLDPGQDAAFGHRCARDSAQYFKPGLQIQAGQVWRGIGLLDRLEPGSIVLRALQLKHSRLDEKLNSLGYAAQVKSLCKGV